MTRYLLLIADQTPQRRPAAAEPQPMLAEYNEYGTWLETQGWIRGGEALQPADTATTVSVRDGQRIVTDGPFAETKEQLAGFYLIDVPSLDDAIEAAARIPGARSGKIEIRPVVEFA